MKTLVIIRTFSLEENLAIRSYKSYMEFFPGCDILFFLEHGQYHTITNLEHLLHFHPNFGNYGGRTNVLGYFEELKKIDVSKYDYIILSDSDTYFVKSLDINTFEFGGMQDHYNPRHFSGQCLIIKKDLFNKIINYNATELIEWLLVNTNTSIADDTIISWIATELTDNIKVFVNADYFIHTKVI